ncbi:MAG: pilus assembly protein TadG-related protein [Planctomycetota bacterium]
MTLSERLSRELDALHRDERGASLVFSAITLFGLAMCALLTYQLGMISADRLRMQNAADAAAYSGAVVEANNLNVMGQINDGMAYVHYNLLRYVIDVTIYRTLETYETHHTRVGSLGFFPPSADTSGAILPAIDPTPGRANQYPPTAENTAALEWVMLGDGPEFQGRLGAADGIQNFPALINQGKTWLRDLASAQRDLMQATPIMVKNHARAIARQNGASHVAFSDDLDRAFQVDQGFYEQNANNDFDNAGGGGDRLGFAVSNRYADGRLGVDGGGFPDWFDWRQGRSKGGDAGYNQIRLCWNTNDWGHKKRRNTQPPGATQRGAPNGHWHARHRHTFKLDFDGSVHQTFHGNMFDGTESPACGHLEDEVEQEVVNGVEGGTFIDSWHNGEHAWVNCPTCGVKTYSGQYTEVKVDHQIPQGGKRDGMALDLSGWPRPLGMRPLLLRSGITVAAWRRGPGIGNFYPASPYGTIAVASAQVGYWSDGEVKLLRELDDQQAVYRNMEGSETIDLRENAKRNFFYSSDPSDGVFFGARLVPVAREYTWTDTPTASALLGPSGRWMRVDGSAEVPPGLANLSSVVNAGDMSALRASIWH